MALVEFDSTAPKVLVRDETAVVGRHISDILTSSGAVAGAIAGIGAVKVSICMNAFTALSCTVTPLDGIRVMTMCHDVFSFIFYFSFANPICISNPTVE